MIIMLSKFDDPPYEFKCIDPQCGDVFKQTLRSLIHADEVTCPTCGTPIDIRESKRTGDIGLWFNTAGEMDKLEELKKKK